MNLPSSRKEAQELDAKRFFNGIPCGNGHIGPRYSYSGQCCECKRITKNAYRAKNLEILRQKDREYARLNKGKRGKNSKKWRNKNADANRAQGAARRARKRNAVPSWLTENDRLEIFKIYSLAKWTEEATGERFHVDHLYPLTSDFLCGLHVPSNLIVMSADDNLSKNNKWWPGQLECQRGRGEDHSWWRELQKQSERQGYM
jgi:hypothetical protein